MRLTVDGKRYTQPLTLRLDPRVKTAPAALAQVATLSREMWKGAHAANTAQETARAWRASLDGVPGAAAAGVRTQLDALAPAPSPRARFRRGPAANTPPTLSGASAAMMGAAMALQSADVAPTARQVAACASARSMGATALASWARLRETGLAAINAERRAAGQAPLTIPVVSAK